MPIPRFSTLRADIDPKLEAIHPEGSTRDREKRYQCAAEMMTDLELYLYSDRYGPTNEKLGTYIKDLFDVRDPTPSVQPLPQRHREHAQMNRFLTFRS
jgi:hypothetical protein